MDRKAPFSYAYRALPGFARSPGHLVWTRLSFRQLKRLIQSLVLLLVSLTLLLLYLNTERFWRPQTAYLHRHIIDPDELAPGQQKLVLVLPVDKPSKNLCKVVASAVAAGYPSPVLVNWKHDFHTATEGIGTSHLAKISGYLAYLEWATSDKAPEEQRLAENDLVFAIDAHDVWLQLPPSVLIQRYHSINQRANARIAQQYGASALELMRQTIIVSSQKACVAPRDKISNLHCSEVPSSPLPDSVYGFFTDYDFWFSRSIFVRPTILNSGSFVGPAGDLRRYFQRVKTRLDEHLALVDESRRPTALGGDQGTFAEVFGEQEVWRKTFNPEDVAEGSSDRDRIIKESKEYEYHVGLDYTQEITFQTCYNEWQGSFVAINNSSHFAQDSSKAGVSPPRIESLGAEILSAEPPFSRLAADELRSRAWTDMALYMDFWTTAVPVGVHYNTVRKGLKGRLVKWWDATWWFPHLRELLVARMKLELPYKPLTVLATADSFLEVVPYLPLEEPKPAILFEHNPEKEVWTLTPATNWETICKDEDEEKDSGVAWYDEVFRDGGGPLL